MDAFIKASANEEKTLLRKHCWLIFFTILPGHANDQGEHAYTFFKQSTLLLGRVNEKTFVVPANLLPGSGKYFWKKIKNTFGVLDAKVVSSTNVVWIRKHEHGNTEETFEINWCFRNNIYSFASDIPCIL